jgi:hypothetical protein
MSKKAVWCILCCTKGTPGDAAVIKVLVAAARQMFLLRKTIRTQRPEGIEAFSHREGPAEAFLKVPQRTLAKTPPEDNFKETAGCPLRNAARRHLPP